MLKKFKPRIIYEENSQMWRFTFIKELEPSPRIRANIPRYMRMSLLRCHCWNQFQCAIPNIKIIKSCGCLTAELTRTNTVHGTNDWYSSHPYYNIIIKAWHRCYNPKNARFKDYGWRWIVWYSGRENNITAFINYLDSKLPPRKRGETLDRIDVNGNYEPWNLRRASAKVQGRNKRNNIYFEYEWKNLPLSQRIEITGVNGSTVYSKYARGIRNWKELFPNIQKEII